MQDGSHCRPSTGTKGLGVCAETEHGLGERSRRRSGARLRCESYTSFETHGNGCKRRSALRGEGEARDGNIQAQGIPTIPGQDEEETPARKGEQEWQRGRGEGKKPKPGEMP